MPFEFPDPAWFLDEDFRFRLGTVPGSAQDFFTLSSDFEETLRERHHWLTTDPDRYAALLPEGTAIAEELLEFVSTWAMMRQAPATLWSAKISAFDRMILLGEQWEPDFVLLTPQTPAADGEVLFTVAGGCVCFPSGWRLTDKLRLPVQDVHEPVPGLNDSLGPPIDRLLSRLRPGKCVVRANWGICRFAEFNQHPDRQLPALTSPIDPEDAWLRREDQCLFTLPKTGGIVFGIRVTHTSWADLRRYPVAARSVARTLRSMPLAMLEYKRLDRVSEELARLLDQ